MARWIFSRTFLGLMSDSNYFMPYILVAEGDEVTKGQKLGEMVLEPGFKSHIHFNSKFQGIFMCPDFFTADVIDQIDDYYMGSREGDELNGLAGVLPGLY